jgi:glycosyltransferase involved in cell wall biosynthesis
VEVIDSRIRFQSLASDVAEMIPRARQSEAMDAPLRVTHVVFDFNGGGMETLVAELAALSRDSSVTVSLVTLSGRVGRLGEQTRDSFDQFHVVNPVRGASMFAPIAVARAIAATHADVVHVHTGSWFKGARAARRAGVHRVIYTEHGREHNDPWPKRQLDHLASRWTDVVVGVSQRLARYLATNVRVDPAKLCVVHNGVDTTTFSPGAAPDELRAALGIPSNALVIGSVGRLEPVKAYHTFLDAVKVLSEQVSWPFVAVICGDGSQRAALTDRAKELGLGSLIRLPGWTDKPVDFYRLLDVFVLPSVSEGQSVSLLEAMACGIAPVVTDVGANAEMIGSDLRGQIVRVSDPEALARVIIATLSGPTDRIGRTMRERAHTLYSLGRMAEQYERLYRGTVIPIDLQPSP